MYKTIALVDVSCLFKRTFEASPNQGAEQTLAELVRLEGRVEHMILCLDAPPYSRKEVFPAYKANRSAPESTEVYQKRWLFEQCKARGFQMARHKGAEGDDVIATLARVYGEACPEVWIVGADKDLAQCVTETVRQLIPPHGDRAEQLRGPAEVKAKYEVWPSQMPLWLALVGDKSDNIPGVPGIGQVRAAGLIAEFKTLVGIAENLQRIGGKVGEGLRNNWEQLVLSLKLATLDSRLPLDADALLQKLEPVVAASMAPKLAIEFDGFMGNETPMPEPAPEAAPEPEPQPLIGKDPRADEFLRQEAAARESMRNADRAALEQQERERARMAQLERDVARMNTTPKTGKVATEAEVDASVERIRKLNEQGKNPPAAKAAPPVVTEAEFDPISRPPVEAPLPPMPPRPEAARPGLAKTSPEKFDYGLVSDDLQPKDLRAAEVLSKWLDASHLYPQFKSSAAIFAVIVRGKEMGIGVTTALSGFHIVEGKPVASADMIRALAIRSPKCKYFRLVHSDETYAEWETLHADHPEPTRYKYTIDEAAKAGLRGGNWEKRKRDMLTKTAGSKLARIVYPMETMGLYAPEEMGDYVDAVGVAA